MAIDELKLTANDFSQDSLIPCKQKVMDSDNSRIVMVDGFMFPNCNAFGLRIYEKKWVLSIRGRLVSYGSYRHVVEIILLLINSFSCWQSETSLIYFLQCNEYSSVITKIMTLRTLDHNHNLN